MKQTSHDEAKRDAFFDNPERTHAAKIRGISGGAGSSLPLLLSGMAIGGALAYFLDPDRGARRRAEVRQQTTHWQKQSLRWGSKILRDLKNRSRGLMHLGKIGSPHPDDRVLHERIRSSFGRKVRHPHSVEVQVQDGNVTLRGVVLSQEVDDLIECVRSVRGVKQIANELKFQDAAGQTPGLQGPGPVYLQ